MQDLLIVRLFALRRHLLDLDPAHAVERDRILELLRGQFLTLSVLRDEVDADTVDLVHRHVGDIVHTLLLIVEGGHKGAETVPLHGLTALQLLHHRGGQFLEHTLHDIVRIDALVEGDHPQQSLQTERLGLPSPPEPLAERRRVVIRILVGHNRKCNFSPCGDKFLKACVPREK